MREEILQELGPKIAEELRPQIAQERNHEIARVLLRKNMTIEFITEVTGLSRDEISRISQQMAAQRN